MRLVKTLDFADRLAVAPFQDASALEYAGLTREQGESAAWLILPHGARYRGAAALWAAFAVIWPIIGDLLLAIYHLPAIRPLQDAAYRWMAANRRRFPSGKAYLDRE
ncbi:MAG: DCC1-like thiol-disulfide oxidoreductase family protein [Ardenticatenaceae bacterium]